MGRKRKVIDMARGLLKSGNFYSDAVLSFVVTRSEAAEMWGKALSTIDYQCLKGGLAYRKSITDGAVLIPVRSLIALWGLPKDDILFELYDGDIAKEKLLDVAVFLSREG